MPQDGHRTSSDLDQAVSGGSTQHVGRFKYFIDEERWEWSAEVQRIHGYRAGALPEPTTAQVLGHKHPDDYEHVLGVIEDTRRTREPFSTRHRMIDAHGREHRVVVVGDVLQNEQGDVLGTEGFYIDVTEARTEYDQLVTDAVTEIAARRAVIEQAKGMLALLYDLDEDAAFELLRWRSQETNTKLRTFAEQVVAKFRAQAGPTLPPRGVYDRTLMDLGGD